MTINMDQPPDVAIAQTTQSGSLQGSRITKLEPLLNPGVQKKKAFSVDWNYVANLNGKYYAWKCNFCLVAKLSEAPQIREHFLGGPKYIGRCTHPNKDKISKRLRDDILR